MSVNVRDAIQDESDRQAVLLALGHLAVERPGWDYMLGLIADKLRGREMYQTFQDLHRQAVVRESERLATIERNSYVCGLCGRRTFHPDDVVASYCSCCGSAGPELPKDCEHRRAGTTTP